MEQKPILRISVRNLVEFILKTGDIVSGFTGSSRLAEGIKGHQRIQNSRPEEYHSEVAVSHITDRDGLTLEVSGRIDGVYQKENGVTIEEIKTTAAPLEYIHQDSYPLYWAQAKCYAYIYAVQNGLDTINIQLTYYQIDTGDVKIFLENFTTSDLEEFYHSLVNEYLHWAKQIQNWAVIRDASIERLGFPFKNYRKGQRELAVAAYKTIKEGNKLFVQAPTGIGKTMATLFPAVKALGEGATSKIFYLTAKTITRTIAENAFEKMRESGLRMKSLTITAKEKICPNGDTICDPMYCEYARGYYDRIKKAVEDVFEKDEINRAVIEEYALKHKVCPFEFSLDVSLWADCIICDYNYAFDPRVYLKRFFLDKGGDYVFLVDEAHNLVDRAREMFSAQLVKREILDVKNAVRKEAPEISNALNRINSFLIQLRKSCREDEAGCKIQKEPPKELYSLLRKFVDKAEKWLTGNKVSVFNELLLELYFNVLNFLKIWDFYDEHYVTYYERNNEDIRLKLFCLDPSKLLNEALERGNAAVLFSATLTPLEYFVKMLGGDENSYRMKLASPFDRDNLCLVLNDTISTRYHSRQFTYDQIAAMIAGVVEGKRGNYLAFFPSYQYMKEVYIRFSALGVPARTICQREGMDEAEREEFLKKFSEPGDQTLVGFAVMGGIFGEGIDLAGDRLSGAVIVGVGLPQICLERDIIRDYFNNLNGQGFEYAYVYPGMNKVLQAVGRVIRTETDRGVVLLIDDRFSTPLYRNLYPDEWHPVPKVRETRQLAQIVQGFWGEVGLAMI